MERTPLLNPHYDDVYARHGLPEKDFVFVQGNQLPQRFAALPSGQEFTVGELGFGLGLAFLATAAAWHRHATGPVTHLHVVSFEKHLVPAATAAACWPSSLSAQPGLTSLQHALQQHWPQPGATGWHTLPFPDANITLHLYLGEAHSGLATLPGPAAQTIDAWFLDGHDPRKNPDLWSADIIRQLARLSVPRTTTVATYSCAAATRAVLQLCHFQAHKIPALPPKRRMLVALYQGHTMA